MGKYTKTLKISLQNTFAYRLDYFISMFVNIMALLIVVFLWQSIFYFHNTITRYSFPSMIFYLFNVHILAIIINTENISRKVEHDIRTGLLNMYLLRPYSYFLSQFLDTIGTKITKTPIIILVTSMVGVCFFMMTERGADVDISLSLPSVSFFIIFVLLSFLWNFVFDFLLGTVGFWVENPWVVFMVKARVTTLLCGLLVPIDLFPPALQRILQFLPFKFYVFFPYKILTGTISMHNCWTNLLIFSLWIGSISLLTMCVWRIAIKKYTAVGG